MNLKFEKPKYRPIDDLIDAYNKTDNVKEVISSDSKEALSQKYKEDPSSLNPTQLVELGLYELQESRDIKAKEQQESADEFINAYEKEEKKRQEYISSNSEEYKSLYRNLTKLQEELNKLAGNGEVVNEE